MTQITRRALLATTAATAAATAIPFAATRAAIAPAAAHADHTNHLCLSSHDWLSRRLHDVVNNPGHDETHKNKAIAANTCSHCGVHVTAGNEGLIGVAAQAA